MTIRQYVYHTHSAVITHFILISCFNNHVYSIGLGSIMVLLYIRVFRNPEGLSLNISWKKSAPLSIKLFVCSAQHAPPEVTLSSLLLEQAAELTDIETEWWRHRLQDYKQLTINGRETGIKTECFLHLTQ